jgi:hypothetical protein
MVEAIIDAVANRAIGEQVGETMTHRVERVGFAAHIEVAFMLPGEAGARQIFRRRRRADGALSSGSYSAVNRANASRICVLRSAGKAAA